MRRALLSSALSLSLLAAPLAAFAQQPPQGPGSNFQPGPNAGGRSELHSIFVQLGLTPEEKSALKSLRQEKSSDEKAARHDLRDAKHAFAQAMLTGSDESAIRAAHDQLSKKREAFEGVRFEGLLAVRRVLSPDQRKKFDSLYIEYKHHQNLQGAEQQ